jgi:hypothetical protein
MDTVMVVGLVLLGAVGGGLLARYLTFDKTRMLMAGLAALGAIVSSAFSVAYGASRFVTVGWLAVAVVMLSALAITVLRRWRQTSAGF